VKTPRFWYCPPDWRSVLLWPVSRLYALIANRRMQRSGLRVAVPVLCIGNVTAGGAGKTPTVITLAKLLSALGERPVVISKGYGAQKRLPGAVLVSPARHCASVVGDEPLLMARQVPVVVGLDRIAAAERAIAAGASLVLMDDGLQSPALHKTASLAVIDGQAGFGNGHVIPAGPLRADLDVQFQRIDAGLVIGAGEAGDAAALVFEAAGKPVFRARLVPDPHVAETLRGQRVIAFCGIGLPEKFTATLRGIGADVIAEHGFADHHVYEEAELQALAAQARQHGACLVTTQKDIERIGAAQASRIFGEFVHAVPVALVLENERAMRNWLSGALA
jgi:tetraacyldisaccharide 4'-kinase